jgi:hypothetical protein
VQRKFKEEKMQTRKPFLTKLSLLMLTAAFLFIAIWNETRVKAFNPQPDPPAVIFGITREQTARLNVANLNGPRTAPVQLAFMFHDTAGNLVGQSVETIPSGGAASYELNGAMFAGTEALRTELIAEVRFLVPPPDPDRGKQGVISSLEVFDNFGPDIGKSRFAVSMNH